MIYEITLTPTTPEVAARLTSWLPGHIELVLRSPGFLQARMYRDTVQSPHTWITQYEVASPEALETYFKERAPALRAETAQTFGHDVTATRRVWDEVRTFTGDTAREA